jgi:tellurite resistance protein
MAALVSNTMEKLGSGPDLASKALELARDACATIRQAKDAASMAYSAYAHAVDIVLADGKVLDLELKFLNTIAQELNLPKSQAGEIITVLRKKNKH